MTFVLGYKLNESSLARGLGHSVMSRGSAVVRLLKCLRMGGVLTAALLLALDSTSDDRLRQSLTVQAVSNSLAFSTQDDEFWKIIRKFEQS
jgi:hypothetical protein